MNGATRDMAAELIMTLDAIDGDTDLEPSLAGVYNTHRGLPYDAEGDDADDEPSLGATEGRFGTQWRFVTDTSDREEDAADLEGKTAPERAGAGFVHCGPDDCEPSLGAHNPVVGIYRIESTFGVVYHDGLDQRGWAGGAVDDREIDVGDQSEDEDEHGGDVQDVPHDAEEDSVVGEDEHQTCA